MSGEILVHDGAQDFCFLQALVGFVGFGHGPARFQMRGDEREGKIGRGANIQFGETAADAKTAAVEQENLVCVRAARDDGQFAQHGHVDIRVLAADQFPIGKVQTLGLERTAQFHERAQSTHFLQREHVGIQRADAFADFGPGGGGFGLRTRFRRLVQIIFHVIGGDPETVRGEGRRTRQREQEQDEREGMVLAHGLLFLVMRRRPINQAWFVEKEYFRRRLAGISAVVQHHAAGAREDTQQFKVQSGISFQSRLPIGPYFFLSPQTTGRFSGDFDDERRTHFKIIGVM